MLLPLLPHHARQLGASPMWIGAVGSVYGVLQLFSGPLVGRLSDIFGRRKILLVCLFMSAVGYTINIFAVSVLILIFARIPLGIFKHGISTVRAFLAEITPRRERPLVFGRFNAISNAGFIIGPLCGGHLAEYNDGFYHVAMCTSAIFFLNLLFVYVLVRPSDRSTLERTKSVAAFTQEYDIDIKENFFQTFKDILRFAGDLLILRLLIGLSVMLYRNNFILIMEERFNTTPKTTGFLISYGALIGVISGMFVGKIVELYGDMSKLLLHANNLLIVTMIGLTFAPSLSAIVFFLTLLSVTNSISRVCVTDISIRRGKLENSGALLGISQSVASVSRSISPFLSGVMFSISPQAPAGAGVLLAITATALMIVKRPDERETEVEAKKL